MQRRQRSQRLAASGPPPSSSSSCCLALTVLLSTAAAALAAAATMGTRGRIPVLLPRATSTKVPAAFGLVSKTGDGGGNSALLLALKHRGGSTAARAASSSGTEIVEDGDEEDECEEEEEEECLERERKAEEEAKERVALHKWKVDQQILLNLRQTILSEMLAKRGIPIATIATVSIADGDKPPEMVDWDCAMSTYDDPKTCLYSFDAEPNTKVVAPLGTAQWISLSALNRLRRTDVAKVEPMWHSKYAVLRSWFSDESEFCLSQHAGVKGFVISNILLDLGSGAVLRSLVLLTLFSAFVVAMPVLEFIVNRLLVSAPFWARWISWHRIARAALPFKLLMGQIAWKAIAKAFLKVEGVIRDYVVDIECSILEECVPLTVGLGATVDDENEDEMEDQELFLRDGLDFEAKEDYSEEDYYTNNDEKN